MTELYFASHICFVLGYSNNCALSFCMRFTPNKLLFGVCYSFKHGSVVPIKIGHVCCKCTVETNLRLQKVHLECTCIQSLVHDG